MPSEDEVPDERTAIERVREVILAEGLPDGLGEDWSLVIEAEEHDFGWVVFYGSDDPDKWLLGNAPYIVDRRTGELWVTGTADPMERYIADFRRYGNPHPSRPSGQPIDPRPN